jgi:hypothetical protein
LQEVEVWSFTVFEIRRPSVVRKHGYEKVFKCVAGPSMKLRQIEDVLEIGHERTAEQGLERRKMPRGAPELRCCLGAKTKGAFAKVVDEGQEAEPGGLHLVQII